jgi:hypothetical protein
MADAAKVTWATVYGALSASQPGLLGAVTARAEAQTIRLALIYALLDGTAEIDEPTSAPHWLCGNIARPRRHIFSATRLAIPLPMTSSKPSSDCFPKA